MRALAECVETLEPLRKLKGERPHSAAGLKLGENSGIHAS